MYWKQIKYSSNTGINVSNSEPELPLVVQGDGLRMVRHKHIMRPFERSKDQSVDRVLLNIL